MSKTRMKSTPEEQQVEPEHLVQAFAACGNFPKEREAVLLLAQQLKRASDDFHIPMSEIIRECIDSSAWCPTPHDIRNVAGELRDKKKKAPFGCEVCQGTGWRSYQHPVNFNDYATFCDCPRGQWMRKCEQDRKTEAKANPKGRKFDAA